ncbi:hypothetical protein Pfo_026686 [Paulownia fortunei]|nr:hypothetical protein Pfo_026686 [Paulownia fortunei]
MEIEYYNLISRLPEEVLLHVVSFLPLKEAVKTSVLSTSWRALWRPYIVNVELDSDQIMQVIGKFLQSYETPELLRLFYRIPDDDSSYKAQKMKEEPDILAAKGVDKELYLDFSNDEQTKEAYILKLKAISGSYSKHPSNVATFASLKTLHLKSVTHIDKEFLSVLFSNSECLECLKLEECYGLRCLDVTAGGSLENVMVLGCPDMAEILISSCNLKSFTYRGVLPQINTKNSPNLIDVTLDMTEGLGQNEFDCEELLSLLASLRNVETLNITGWLLAWLCSAGVIFQRLDFRFSMLKQLHISEPCMNRSRLDSLACFLDICPSLEKLYIKIDRERKDVICPYFYQYWHEPYFGMENSILKPKTSSRLEHLRVVEISGFEIQEYGLWLLDLLLRRALLLNSMTVKSWDDMRWEVIKFPLSQLEIASRNKQNLMTCRSSFNISSVGITYIKRQSMIFGKMT